MDLEELLNSPSSLFKAEASVEGSSGDSENSHALSHKIIASIKSEYISLPEGATLDLKKLEFLIGEIIWEWPEQKGVKILRCKGCFVEHNSKKTHILQGVEDLFEFRECPESPEVQGKFLFVGKGPIEGEQILNLILERCQA